MSEERTKLQLYGFHTPEYSQDVGPDGNYVKTELPGFYTVGVEVDGAFVKLAHFPAGNLLRDIKRAKDAKASGEAKSG
jgi:hypothetical protein